MAGYVNGLKLSNGIYVYRIMVHGRVRTGTTMETRLMDAESALTIIKAGYLKSDAGIEVKKAPTLDKAIALWAHAKKGSVTDRYIGILEKALRTHFKALLTRPIDKIEKGDIQQLLSTYLQTHARGPKQFGGYNQLLTYWHSLYRERKGKKLCGPYDEIIPDYKKSQRRVKRILKPEHINAVTEFIDNRYGLRMGIAFRLGLYLGLRSVEVSKATWKCVDWTDSEWRNYETKGLECDFLPIPPTMLEALKRWKGPNAQPNDPIVPLLNGESASPLTRIARRALEQAGMAVLGHKISTHDLRGSYITHLHKQGINIKVIQALARHSDIATTLRYIELDEADKKDAVKRAFGA